MGLTPAFTRFAYTPPGYAAAGSPAARPRIAEDRRADTIQKTADRQTGNAPIQAISIPIQAEAEAVRQAEEGRQRMQGRQKKKRRQTQKTAAADRFLSSAGCLYSFIASNTGKAGKAGKGRKRTEDRSRTDRRCCRNCSASWKAQKRASGSLLFCGVGMFRAVMFWAVCIDIYSLLVNKGYLMPV